MFKIMDIFYFENYKISQCVIEIPWKNINFTIVRESVIIKNEIKNRDDTENNRRNFYCIFGTLGFAYKRRVAARTSAYRDTSARLQWGFSFFITAVQAFVTITQSTFRTLAYTREREKGERGERRRERGEGGRSSWCVVSECPRLTEVKI